MVADMTTTLRVSRVARVAAPLLFAGALGAMTLFPGAAMADPAPSGAVTATYAGAGVGYNKVLDGHAAGTVELTVDGGATVSAFCVQYAKDMATSGTYASTSWSGSGVANLGKAADIAVRHASIGTPLADPKSENAAAQLAIWHYTDSVDFSTVPNASIVTRASALVAAASTHTEAPASFNLAVAAKETGTGTASKDTVTATVTTDAGTPVAGAKITFTAAGHTADAVTDSAGVATDTLAAPAQAGTMTVDLATQMAAGAVLVPAGKQAMITTDAVAVTRTANVALATAVAAPTSAAPTSKAPTTSAPAAKAHTSTAPTHHASTSTSKVAPAVATSSAPPKSLPYTGGWAQPWMFAVAVAGAIGGLFARRKFVTRRGH